MISWTLSWGNICPYLIIIIFIFSDNKISSINGLEKLKQLNTLGMFVQGYILFIFYNRVVFVGASISCLLVIYNILWILGAHGLSLSIILFLGMNPNYLLWVAERYFVTIYQDEGRLIPLTFCLYGKALMSIGQQLLQNKSGIAKIQWRWNMFMIVMMM